MKQQPINWCSLRVALGMTQFQFAGLMGICVRSVRMLESNRAVRPSQASMTLLRAWLRDPELQRRLSNANFPYPFPEDLNEAARTRELTSCR
jgi:transcriptional regulator with XRE-family HTH domain